MVNKCLTRRKFITLSAKTAGAFFLSNSIATSISFAETFDKVPVAVFKDPNLHAGLKGAMEAIGGMKKIISKNDVVLLKPNIGWDRVPEQAANTNPELVVSLLRLVLESGAKEIRVFDRTCNEPRRCYINSGIESAVREFSKKEGVEDRVKIYHIQRRKFVRVDIKDAEVLDHWPLYRDALEVDKIINVPVAKHHSLAGYTLSLKNMMGVMGGNRSMIHWRLSPVLADLNGYLKTHLAVIDGMRILLRNGPSGGNLKDVLKKDTIIVSPNPVAADAVAAKVLFGTDPGDIRHIKEASIRGLGPIGEKKIKILSAKS